MVFPISGELARAAYVFPLVLAAVSDFHSLRIPNALTVGLAAGFPAAALLCGHDVAWLSHVAAGLGVFAAAAALFAFRLVGGGDAKLLAATALWLGLGGLMPFLVATALVGGVFALVLVGLRLPPSQAAFLAVLRRLPRIAEASTPIPYGIPIAIAGIAMLPTLDFLT